MNGGNRRGCEDGSGHMGGTVGTPPSLCVQGPHGNAPLYPPAPCLCNGGVQNPGLRTEDVQVKWRPSTLCVSTTLHASRMHDPCTPTFRVPHAHCPACGAACKGWYAKGGARRGCARETHTGSCSHPFLAVCHPSPLLVRPRLLRMHHPQPLRATCPLHPTQARTQEGEAPLPYLHVHTAVPPPSVQRVWEPHTCEVRCRSGGRWGWCASEQGASGVACVEGTAAAMPM